MIIESFSDQEKMDFLKEKIITASFGLLVLLGTVQAGTMGDRDVANSLYLGIFGGAGVF